MWDELVLYECVVCALNTQKYEPQNLCIQFKKFY